jgi:hypothetical protein
LLRDTESVFVFLHVVLANRRTKKSRPFSRVGNSGV